MIHNLHITWFYCCFWSHVMCISLFFIHQPFNSISSSHRLNVRVITISVIFKLSSTKNLVCPCTVNGDPSGSIPLDLPENVPSSYQCAYTQLFVRPLPHVGLCILYESCNDINDNNIPTYSANTENTNKDKLKLYSPIMKLNNRIRMCH